MNMGYRAQDVTAFTSSSRTVLRLTGGTASICITVAGVFGAGSAAAQAPLPNLVSACSGVSLPRSVVKDIVSPVISGIVAPVQNTVNPLLDVTLPPLNIDATTLLANAAAGQPITLQALNSAGTVVGRPTVATSRATRSSSTRKAGSRSAVTASPGLAPPAASPRAAR